MPRTYRTKAERRAHVMSEAIDAVHAAKPIEGKSRLIMVVDFDSVLDKADAGRIIDEGRAYGSVQSAVYFAASPSREELA